MQKKQESELHWGIKWRRHLETSAGKKERYYVGGKVECLRQFNYEHMYRVLEFYFSGNSKLKNMKGSKFLEVGCGRGTTSINLLQKHPSVSAFMADSSLDAICIAKKNVLESKLHGYFVVADAFNLPFKDSVFSLVFSIGLLEHFPNPNKAVAEQCRLLKRNGLWMALIVPMKNSINSFVKNMFHLYGMIHGNEIEKNNLLRTVFWEMFRAQKTSAFRNAFLDDYYRRLLESRGDIEEIEYIYLDPFFVSSKNAKIDSILTRIYKLIIIVKKELFRQAIPYKTFKVFARSLFLKAKKQEAFKSNNLR